MDELQDVLQIMEEISDSLVFRTVNRLGTIRYDLIADDVAGVRLSVSGPGRDGEVHITSDLPKDADTRWAIVETIYGLQMALEQLGGRAYDWAHEPRVAYETQGVLHLPTTEGSTLCGTQDDTLTSVDVTPSEFAGHAVCVRCAKEARRIGYVDEQFQVEPEASFVWAHNENAIDFPMEGVSSES